MRAPCRGCGSNGYWNTSPYPGPSLSITTLLGERICTGKNRMPELGSSGSVRREGSNAITYSECQHPVVAVAVDARGRDQRGQPVDQLQRREAQLAASSGLRPGQAIDELVVSSLLEPLQAKGGRAQ